ncbi:gag protein [Colletotrichum truncatum]|nr:gag protein [Colletotrichum truncatum]KAF6781503.1 gag protein [Colletotrichum truncatum]
MSSSSAKITLNTPADWILWIDQLQSKAKSYDLWRYIDPQRPGALNTGQTRLERRMERPKRPEIYDHPKTGKAEVLNEDADYETRAQALEELSAANLALYKERRSEYMERSKTHEAADRALDRWVYALKERVGITTRERRTAASEAYKRALQIPERKRLATKKELEEWLTKWEESIHEAAAAGVPGTELPSIWFPEFTYAVSHSYADTWIFSYQTVKDERVESEKLSVGEVLSDARRFL